VSEQIRSLKEIALFSVLDEAERSRLEALCKWRRYDVGQRVVESGSASREVFFVLSGELSVVNAGPSGREVIYAKLAPGEYFGELSALDNKPRSANVVAHTPSEVAVMGAEVFTELLQTRAEVTFQVLQRLTHMVRSADVRIMELITMVAGQRVYSELLRMARRDVVTPTLWVIHPLPPIREIAERAGTTRETAARALSNLYPAGLARRKGRNLYLMDRAGIEALVQEPPGG
jgi:CRP-like cAMP-binding protein